MIGIVIIGVGVSSQYFGVTYDPKFCCPSAMTPLQKPYERCLTEQAFYSMMLSQDSSYPYQEQVCSVRPRNAGAL